ncbi:unnamed protein product [Oikopleura dioica]|uniref:Uncharacterized protein n=1 Tax=Oikopleura dioica TaxID=34765 RepID=E4X9W1_OIKDI|nr:unnamed protein product [Oikopleura dioica]
MASGVLSFLRGIDLTRFPIGDTTKLGDTEQLKELQNVRWLKLARTGLKVLPAEIVCCQNLEELDISYNQLASLEDLSELPNLKSLIAKSNLILETSLPPEIFHKELNVLDLQKNKLRAVPERLEEAEGLLVLNLADNQISEIPQTTFVNLCDLMHLDLSGNKLETLPAQMRRLSSLRIMNISNNPLGFAQLRQLPSLIALKELYLSNTQRTAANLPQSFEEISQTLEVIDLSSNQLQEIPDCLFECVQLRRLNLSNNEISEVHLQIDKWHHLRNLNLSNNKLTSLPASLQKLTQLTSLYISENQFDFEGIPRSIGKLGNLEVFSAAFNILETVPEGLTRCIKLRKMTLNNNKLITLPESIHFMPNLRDLDVRNNPSFVMPPKPSECKKEDEMSYDAQLRRMGQLPEKKEENTSQKKYERRIKLRKIRESIGASGDTKNGDANKVLAGLKEIEGKGDADMDNEITGGKSWMDNLKGPTLDYNGVFDEFTGQSAGVTVWQIDNFYPVLQDETLHGKFYTGDCYIILDSKLLENRDLEHKIYFWIGDDASLDKKACAAMHAVNLRNMLQAKSRTSRQEMNDEDDEFLDLFEDEIQYIAGGSESGFYLVEKAAFETRLFCVEDAAAPRIYPVPLKPTSLHAKQCLILDTGNIIYCWLGMMAKNVVKSKCRLIADKINKYERKGLSEVILVYQGYEESDFWQLLGGMPDKVRPLELQQFRGPRSPRLYKVCLGSGYLELPQLNYRTSIDHNPKNQPRLNLLPHLRLLPSLLDSKGVYILDCTGQIFVWIGKHSQRLARAAAWKLASEMSKLPGRPAIDIRVTKELEGTETVGFRHMFKGWDNVLSIDYSKAVDTVPEKELQLRKDRQANAADMSALFLSRQRTMPFEEAVELGEEWGEDLESMKCFVLEGKKFVHLPEDEKGQFYSQNCYVFVCRYLYPRDKDEDVSDESDEDEEEEDNLEVIVYFWEGRDANQLGWLTFTFTLQKNLEEMFADKLVIRRMKQQQEGEKFLSHFDGNFIIMNGKRFTKGQREKILNREDIELPKREPILLQTRSTGSMFTTRTVQVACEPISLNSEFCHILIVPFSGGGSGMVYGWIGRCAEPREATIMGNLMDDHLPVEFKRYSKQVINEGEEPENFFWVGIGADISRGIPRYSEDAEYLRISRLFRCTNETGYFNVSEKCSDFCQADLQDDDVMLLDTGAILYLWVGSSSSQTEVKFGLKAAAVYLQHLKAKGSPSRKLKAVRKGNEVADFKQCFHGWREW